MERGLKLLKERALRNGDSRQIKDDTFEDTISQLNKCEREHRTDECGCEDCYDSTRCVKLFDTMFA